MFEPAIGVRLASGKGAMIRSMVAIAPLRYRDHC
jgi:hypothetical protein